MMSWRILSFNFVWLTVIVSSAIPCTRTAIAQDDPKPPGVVRAGHRNYEVLDYSPDHRFALAWGMSRRQVDFSKFDPEGVNDGDPVDCIVDCQKHELVATLDGFQHYPHLNHSSMTAIWDKAVKHAFVTWQGKWRPNGFSLVTLRGTNRGAKSSMPSFEKAIDKHIQLVTGQRSPIDYLALECEPHFVSSSHLKIAAHAYPSKYTHGWFYDCTVVYDLPTDGKLNLRTPSPVGLTRTMHVVCKSNDDNDIYTESDVIAEFNSEGAMTWRAKTLNAVAKGTDQVYQRSLIFEASTAMEPPR